jgi:Protein of unknown function (DUF3987)
MQRAVKILGLIIHRRPHKESILVSESFINNYLQYTSDSECPVTFHRWSALAGIGAILERNIYVKHGNSDIYPNQYMMLIGTAGTRKSTGIKLIKSMMTKAGYTTIAAERTSKEKFLLDLAGYSEDAPVDVDGILERNLFGNVNSESDIRSMSIMADEANDFFGISNLEFLSILGSMWDWSGLPYQNRIKTGKSVSIPNPTITILSGNTPTGFTIAFPPEILGQGFFSRLLLIYGKPNGRKIAFPRTSNASETAEIVNLLQRVKSYYHGELNFMPSAKNLLIKIYEMTSDELVRDMRFDSYFNRRFMHLLKLCVVCAADELSPQITENIVIRANTYLSYAESLMPKALGEFGKSRNSDVTHKVLHYIDSNDGVKLKDIIKLVSSDLDKPSDIGDILRKLSSTDKIQVSGGLYLPMRKKGIEDLKDVGVIDISLLTQEELDVKG